MNTQISFFLIALALCTLGEAAVSTKRRCADENCTVPISKAKTLVKYSAPEAGILSFHPGEEVVIYSKEAGNNMDLWGAELRGKRGYLPKALVKEYKMLVKQFEHVVDTEYMSTEAVPSKPSSSSSSSDTTETIIIDGTTLYNDIVPSTTQQPQHSHPSTAVPEKQENKKMKESVEVFEVKSEDEQKETKLDAESLMKESKKEELTDDVEIESEEDEEDDEDDEDDEDEDLEEETVNNEMPKSQTTENVHNEMNIHDETKDDMKQLNDNTLNITTESVTQSELPPQQPQNVGAVETVKTVDTIDTLDTFDTQTHQDNHQANEVRNEPVAPVASSTEAPPIDQLANELRNEPIAPVAPSTEAPSVQTPPPTKLPLFFHNVNTPAAAPSVVQPESEENLNNLDTLDTVVVDTVESEDKNLDFNDTLARADVSEDSMAEFHRQMQIFNDATTESPLSVSKKTVIETEQGEQSETIENEGYEPIMRASGVESEPGFFDFLTTPEPSINEVTPESPGLYEFLSQPASQETTPEPSSDEHTAHVTNEPDAISIADERKPNDDLTNPESDASEAPPSWNVGGVDTTSEEQAKNEAESEPNIETESAEEGSEGNWYDSLFNFFGASKEEEAPIAAEDAPKYTEAEDDHKYEEVNDDVLLSQYASHSCPADDTHCHSTTGSNMTRMLDMFEFKFTDTLMIVAISGACVVLFLWGYMLIEKMRKEGPLVGKINHLEQQLLIMAKENEVLGNKVEDAKNSHQEINENVSSELVVQLQRELDDALGTKLTLEEQIQSLEKELENSTEVGLELNKMLSDVLSSQNGSDTVMANIEQLQKQLVEQQATINSVNDKLNEKDTENHELQLELEINNKKVVDLRGELEKMMLNLLRVEEEKEVTVSKTEGEVVELRETSAKLKAASNAEIAQLTHRLEEVKVQLDEAQRSFEVKSKEYTLLKEGLSDSDANKKILEHSTLKAELLQLQQDNKQMAERLGHEQIIGRNSESEVKRLTEDKTMLKKQYESADKEKLEALTKLEVLSTYFKEKEAALQSQLAKHEALWSEKQGENTSTSERMKFMQEEIRNFKSQVASLQQEIVSQEVDLKSQISVLEKKAHENWVTARQAERRIEDARQEAAQLRNMLTLREEKAHNRNGLSPLETNGVDHHLNDTASPPLLFGARDHMTTSPPLLPGLPPGFPMPPPPGVGGPPFLPPFMPGMPPSGGMFPGDHRPPPLGRMSSPPLNSRYTPDARAFSPYDRRSPSPTDDDYYERDDRDYYNHRAKRNSGRRSGYSSGSNSNESLDKMERPRAHAHSKV